MEWSEIEVDLLLAMLKFRTNDFHKISKRLKKNISDVIIKAEEIGVPAEILEAKKENIKGKEIFPRSKWTQKEITYLIESWNVISLEKISKNLERSPGAVKHKARISGLTRPPAPLWTTEEIKILIKERKKKKDWSEIAALLNRSPLALKRKWERFHDMTSR